MCGLKGDRQLGWRATCQLTVSDLLASESSDQSGITHPFTCDLAPGLQVRLLENLPRSPLPCDETKCHALRNNGGVVKALIGGPQFTRVALVELTCPLLQ